MREPSTQTRILASPPVFFGSWAFVLWLTYIWWQGAPIVLGLGIAIAFLMRVMQADEQVRAWKAWKREWDAMSALPPRPRRWPTLVGMALGVPFTSLLFYAGQHGGAQAIIGVILVIVGPLLVIGLALKTLGWAMRRRPAQTVTVTVCVRRPLLPVPSIESAYRGLPDHCRAIMRTRP